MHDVDLGAFKVGGEHAHILIAGPCVIGRERVVMDTAQRVAELTRALGMPYVFKSSYDKASRSSIKSFRGLGLNDGLKILRKVKEQFGLAVLTDVHTTEEAKKAAEVVD